MQATKALTVIGEIRAMLAQGVRIALEKAKDDDKLDFDALPDIVIEVPREEKYGDFATNAAMQMARAARKNPREIAQIIADYFPTHSTSVDSVEIAGPGFINFHLKDTWLTEIFAKIVTEGEQFGNSSFGEGKKVQVEFVSANPTGELHMGNARGAAIGDTLAGLLQLAGYQVEREFYINDAGNQIEKFANSLEARYLQALGENVPFPEDGYHGEDITKLMASLVEKEGDKYQKMEGSLRRELLTSYALKIKLSDIRSVLSSFAVEYDCWFSEQSLHDSGAVEIIVKRLQEEGWLLEKEGALWLDCSRFGSDEKPEVLVRSNGVPTYYAADIAYHDNKFKRGFDTVINVWGADHHGHVARMQGAMEALGYDRNRLEVILMQLVRLYRGGEIVKMSKRTGTYVTLNELIEEVGKDAARFFFVARSADSQMDFDLDLAVTQSSDNPVYYVQYAHARICSILAAAAGEGLSVDENTKINYDCLTHESELQLIRKLADFPDEVVKAAVAREPHHIAAYVLDLAGLFHNFYSHCRVLGVDKELSLARLQLITVLARVIKKALAAMGVSAPQKM